MKTIPLSEPMGGDSSCCIHEPQCMEIKNNKDNNNSCCIHEPWCREIKTNKDNDHIIFRCPLVVTVDDDVDFAGEWHESCILN